MPPDISLSGSLKKKSVKTGSDMRKRARYNSGVWKKKKEIKNTITEGREDKITGTRPPLAIMRLRFGKEVIGFLLLCTFYPPIYLLNLIDAAGGRPVGHIGELI